LIFKIIINRVVFYIVFNYNIGIKLYFFAQAMRKV